MTAASSDIRVKVASRSAGSAWARYFPGGNPRWGRCRFTFERDARRYDWLVVYEDIPPAADERFSISEEKLACGRDNTLLVTTEPSTIKTYGRPYTAQFGHVLTSQAPWALPHPNHIHSQPALFWLYGVSSSGIRSYDQIVASEPTKTRPIATVCSAKKQRHTLHNRRYRFTQSLSEVLPELDVYGYGVRQIDDKADSVDPYRYHLAIENFAGRHHWTEKLSDAFLGLSVPIYAGCPNAGEYFPPESFIAIDLFDPQASIATIQRAIANDEYSERLSAVREARRRVLDEYGFFAVVSKIVEERYQPGLAGGGTIRSRRAANRATIGAAASFGAQKLVVRARHRLSAA